MTGTGEHLPFMVLDCQMLWNAPVMYEMYNAYIEKHDYACLWVYRCLLLCEADQQTPVVPFVIASFSSVLSVLCHIALPCIASIGRRNGSLNSFNCWLEACSRWAQHGKHGCAIQF